MVSARWLFIRQCRACPVSPTYWRPHFLHWTRYMTLDDLHVADVLIVYFRPVLWLVNSFVINSIGHMGNSELLCRQQYWAHEKPVAQHFTTSGHSVEDMGVLVIETLWREDPVLRKIRESKWIRALETSCPKGMNLRVDSL